MRILKFLILILLVTSCRAKLEEPSMDRESFKRILADMHIAEEMISKFRLADRDSVRDLYFYEISQIHKTDTATIANQINILQANPEYAFSMYQEVYKHVDEMSVDSDDKKEK